MPGREKKKKNGGRKREIFPKKKVKGRESKICGRKEDEEKPRGRTVVDPSWDPGIAGSVGNAKEECG